MAHISSSLRGKTYRPRGFSSNRQSSTETHLLPKRDIYTDLSLTPLQTITKLQEQHPDKEVNVGDLQLIGSYNWVEAPTPTIIVPGSPREWLNRPTPYQVDVDVGSNFSDQNGYRCPSSVLLPLVTAVDLKAEADGEPFNWGAVDLVTDRNGLRKLLRWIGNTATTDFRIDTQLAGAHTVLLNRWERRTREEMSGFTYGFNFEKESTRAAPGCERSTGHHRIVQYDLNGLRMVVRFEVDACIPSTIPSASRPQHRSSANVGDLVREFANVKLQPPEPGSTVVSTMKLLENQKLTVMNGGSYVPQSAIVELTTRSIRREAEFDFKESYPQLFLSQTPHHFLGVHERGRFIRVNKRKLGSAALKEVADISIQPELKKLRRLLDIIKDLVVKHGQGGRLSLVCQSGELKVYERPGQDSCLPDGAMKRFDI